MDTDGDSIPSSFNFPFTPYKIQEDFMRCLYGVLSEEKIGIFESPTGTVSFLVVFDMA